MRIIMDRNTRRSKGFAYIEMATRESIIPALSLAGQTLMGQSVMVKSSEVCVAARLLVSLSRLLLYL